MEETEANQSNRSRNPNIATGVENTVPLPNRQPTRDALTTEFMYLSSTIRTLAPALSKQADRERVMPWLKKLFSPEYHAERFREKRNKYLVHLTITLMSDGLQGIFLKPPPCGALPHIDVLLNEYEQSSIEWEQDKTWEEIRTDMIDVPLFSPMACKLHQLTPCPDLGLRANTLLDNMFRYLLYLLRPCAALFPCPVNKTKVTAWMQHLCSIGPEACSYMKGVRNDYAMALYAYASGLRLAGIFQLYPVHQTLVSLPRAAKRYAERHPLMDPTSAEAEEFLRGLPVPKTGAFCYITISEPSKVSSSRTQVHSVDEDDEDDSISEKIPQTFI